MRFRSLPVPTSVLFLFEAVFYSFRLKSKALS